MIVCFWDVVCLVMRLLKGVSLYQENQENVSNLVIDDTELKQVAYIYKCVNTTLHIKGKINSITVGEFLF